MSIDLDAPLCEGCKAPLSIVRHANTDDSWINEPVLQVWPDGLWSYHCECGWEHNDGTGTLPSWRRWAPELCDEVERLTRIEAAAEALYAACHDEDAMAEMGDDSLTWSVEAERAASRLFRVIRGEAAQ